MLEVVDACIAVWGADRVGLHLAPRGDAVSMGDSNPLATFGYVAQAMGRRKIAFLCTRERQGPDSISPQLKRMFGGAMIANEKFTKETAEAAIEAGVADAVAFGQLYIANPDLPERFKLGAPLNTPDPSTFYAQGPKGYTDYPALARETGLTAVSARRPAGSRRDRMLLRIHALRASSCHRPCAGRVRLEALIR